MENILVYPTRQNVGGKFVSEGILVPKAIAEKGVKSGIYTYELTANNIHGQKELYVLNQIAQKELSEKEKSLLEKEAKLLEMQKELEGKKVKIKKEEV